MGANDEEEQESRSIRAARLLRKSLLALAITFALIVSAAYLIKFGTAGFSDEQEVWGQFGDYVGGLLNPIFAFLALIGFLATLVVQTKELELTRNELKKSSEALKKQHEALSKQNFENTFFQLLRRFSEIVRETRTRTHVGGSYISGLEAMEQLRGELRKEYKLATQTAIDASDPIGKAIFAYSKFHHDYRHLLGQYFRTLYHIFKFIDRSQLTESEKVGYANVARAQLSSTELTLLFYNGTVGEGKDGFKPLIEKYGLLHHVNPGDLFHAAHHEPDAFYNVSAFLDHQGRS